MIRTVRATFADWEAVLRNMTYEYDSDSWHFLLDGNELWIFHRDGQFTTNAT